MSTPPSAFTVCKGITHAAIGNPFGIFVNYNTVGAGARSWPKDGKITLTLTIRGAVCLLPHPPSRCAKG
jgi:hypothetical protein